MRQLTRTLPANNSIKIKKAEDIRKTAMENLRETKKRKSEKYGSAPKRRKSDQRCAEPLDMKKKEQESQPVAEINRLAKYFFVSTKLLEMSFLR